MNFKTTYILFGLLGLMLAVLGFVLYSGPGPRAGEGFVFPSMHAKDKPFESDKVDKVVVQRKKPSEPDIVFERIDPTTWKLTAPKAAAVDSQQVTSLIDQLKSAEFQRTDAVPSVAKAGLDSPTRIIKLHAGDRVWTLNVGDTTEGTDSAAVYVISSDLPGKTLAVSKNAIATALEGYEYFRAKELLGNNSADIRAVKLTQGKKAVALKKDKERWVMTQPSSGDIEIGELLGQLTNLRVDHKDAKTTDFVKDGVTDLAEYNLDPAKSEVLRIDVTRETDGKTTTRSALIGTSKKVGDKSYYAALDADAKAKDVVKVSVISVEPIQKWVDDPSAFRSKNLLALDSFRRPDAILIKNKYGDLEFFRTDEKELWQLYRGTTANSVDPIEVIKLIDELNKKGVIVSFPDPSSRATLGVDKPDVTVRVFADSLEKPDAKKPGKPVFKKDAKPITELRFGNPKDATVAVDRIWGSDSTLVMVPKTLDLQVREGPLAYIDRSIPPFNPGPAEENVTKVELTRGGQTYVVTRAGPATPWKIEQPAALKGRTAGAETLREILGKLNRLTAGKIVTEKADDLGSYNLVKPPVRVAVTLTKDGKPATTTFDFGGKVAGGVYLKISGKDAIYEVSPDTLVPLEKEMRDTSVFEFDPSMVTTLTVRGWKSLLGSPGSLTFEQKDNVWTTKETGYPLDGTKVAAFVAGLSRLHLDRFSIPGKGLTLAEDALQVEITLANKSVLELTVGAADGAGYAATSKQLAGDSFVVGRPLFEDVRKARAYFAK